MLPKHEPTSKFGKWLNKYRLLIILILFIVVVPVAFVVSLYLGDYLKYKAVTFGNESITEFQGYELLTEDDTNHQVITIKTTDLTYSIKWMSYTTPLYDDETGTYVFRVKYEEHSNKFVSNVQATLILQTQWINAKSQPKPIVTQETYSTNQNINFNYVLPKSPLWFVTVEMPDLYVKLSYDIQYGLGTIETKVSYHKIDLINLIPANQIGTN
ncbi:hypothetical protein JV173_03495 [Acholeplasma equirhinis]|uniref:hypothetical protein n=1 Tax=Acholeplasma equirhinis TaxID=555393 RepID=UPI00197AEB33|nr:hypothetical protein [Acholeplasma equirhinis]MBN3490574.1 hypothetical protein [Acholeplasma equirhinis]